MSGEQIKPGYKLTEVGVIPEDWEVKSIDDVSQIYGRIGADSKVKCNTCKPRKVSRCKHHPGATSNSSPKTV